MPVTPKNILICCMCNCITEKNKTLTPSICHKTWGSRSHRICRVCWWNKFAIEDASHKCPGCIKNTPLTDIALFDSI